MKYSVDCANKQAIGVSVVDGFSFWPWAAITVACYAFVPSFRREINGWIVKLADKVKNDTLEKSKEPETHFMEDVAFEMFKGDHPPNDPRIAGGWRSLSPEVRASYITKAFESLLKIDRTPVKSI